MNTVAVTKNSAKRAMSKVQRMTMLAILAAIVIVLQVAVSIPLGPFTITLTLVPIIIGAILDGPAGGAFLGAVFGAVVSIQVITGAAGAFSTMMLEYQPVATILVCLLKGTLAGLVSGLFFRLFSRIHYYSGVLLAAIIAPIVNTGIFSVAALTIFRGLIAGALGTDQNLLGVFLTTFIGLNFVVEFAINVALTPVIIRIVRIVKKDRN
ncbi:MAG: ECF transporter S component [Lachnospiraceae bacterium]|nr:ECF transporter S component [Lachnospiraceae bacterium]